MERKELQYIANASDKLINILIARSGIPNITWERKEDMVEVTFEPNMSRKFYLTEQLASFMAGLAYGRLRYKLNSKYE